MKINDDILKFTKDGYKSYYGDLGNAVIIQAVKDYDNALRRHDKHPNDIKANQMIYDCETFFEKDIELYTDLDGNYLMQWVQNNVKQDMNKQQYRTTPKHSKI